jgi:soluble lytic murein transglycosylase-like protein
MRSEKTPVGALILSSLKAGKKRMMRPEKIVVGILILSSLCLLSSSQGRSYMKTTEGTWSPPYTVPAVYMDSVQQATDSAEVPLWLFARLIERESGWDPLALNHNRNGTKDLGIAQFNDRYLPDFTWFDNDGKTFNPWKPTEALPVAARYLRRLYDATHNWRDAVLAYNAGLSRVREGNVPSSSVRHADFVMGGYE